MESSRRAMRYKAASLMFAIVVGMLLVLWVTKVFIAPKPANDFTIYNPPEEEATQVVRESKPLSGGQPPASPTVTDVIVSTQVMDVASVTFDPMGMPDSTGSSSTLGSGDLGDGVGEGGNSGGMGSGEKLASSFQGTLWDFKRFKDGKDSPLAIKPSHDYGSTELLALESKFYNKVWDSSLFSPYFRSKNQLYATCFYMPNCLDQEACNAYDPDGKMGLKKMRWAALYRAKVKAPVTGKFRFVGIADSLMAVRFNGKNVLACGLHNLNTATMNDWTVLNAKFREGRTLIPYESCNVWNEDMGGFVVGETFSVTAGEWYDMQVLISEIGGLKFGFCLLIEELGEEAKKTPDGQPLYQLFRTALSSPTAKEAYESMKYVDDTALTDMPYDPDSRVWDAKPQGLEVKMK